MPVKTNISPGLILVGDLLMSAAVSNLSPDLDKCFGFENLLLLSKEIVDLFYLYGHELIYTYAYISVHAYTHI